MKILVFVILISCIPGSAFCQSGLSSIVRQREIFTPYYEMTSAGGKVLYLPMNYGRSAFSYKQEAAVKSLKNATVVRVDLVYSDYPAKADFSLLTKRRLETLQKMLPAIFSDKNIEFRKIRQTLATTKAVAAGLQHGFFIYFRPLPTKTSGEKEARVLKSLLMDTSLERPARDSSSTVWFSESMIMGDTAGATLPDLPANYTREITRISVEDAVSRGYLEKETAKEYKKLMDTVFCIEDKRDGGCDLGDYSIYDLPDSTVTQVLKRHKWSHSLIVADVTGSMYPYSAQLLKWVQLTLTDKENRYFVFFNDGDNKDDDKKVIGRTGGIYPVYTNEYDRVEKTIIRAMENGSGGDAPENNIEALLESEKVCKGCDSIVMIADNWAPIKDISLLSSYHRPVKVILCGVFDRINKDYLKLARDTKGSLHLIEEDIYRLSELKEGETIKIHGLIYRLTDGNFVDVTPGTL
ncbi:hypothetical protein [Puia dinghuensis]|uniref:VWA domain-containing protein n=1 Tax=Puia dinghuensis TaxID=1792502 RepID=A0A8J2XV10_9BACT|nr:hypothetical protein [Puia dinghuensis]GGB15416.1 hypothetical protein GCM10011511_44000 [Puia dinghuensis]